MLGPKGPYFLDLAQGKEILTDPDGTVGVT